MREKKSKKNIVMFFIKMLLVFIAIDFTMMLIAGLLAETSLVYKYGEDLIIEMFYSLAILVVLLLYKNSYVFTDKKEKFFSGVMLAIPMLIISFVNFFDSITSIENFSLASFLNMFVFCIFIGIAEEFLCRGWIQNEFIERFSDNKKETILSIVLASLVFGFMHIMNLASQPLFETILQIVNATALGLLLGSIYYKTKNIWSVIFLHSFYDFSIFLGEIDMVKDCTYNDPTLGVTIVEGVGLLIVSALWIFSAIYVLNKCEFDGKPQKKNNVISLLIVITFILLLIPFERFIPNYDDYQVCYHYNEIEAFKDYDMVVPIHEKYYIESIDDVDFYKSNHLDSNLLSVEYKFEVYKDKNNEIVIIKNMLTNYEKKYKFNDIKDLVVFENHDGFSLAILTTENESTIYYTNYFVKGYMSNEDDYLDDIKFTKYALPEISSLGYIDVKEDDQKYIYMISKNYDRFVVIEDDLFIIKK